MLNTIQDMNNINGSDMSQAALNVTIHQKRRGQGKKISQIDEGECIRVDKQKGKALHLEVTGKMAAEYTPDNKVEVTAVDLCKEATTTSFTNEGIKLVSITKANNKLTLILKVHRNARCLVFGVVITNKDNQVSFGHSVSINAHNNGKQNASRSTKSKGTTARAGSKRKRSQAKEDQVQEQDQAPAQWLNEDIAQQLLLEYERPAVKPKLNPSVPSILVTTDQTFLSPWSSDCSDLSFLAPSDGVSSPYSSDISSPSSSEMSPYSSGFSSPYSGELSPSGELSSTEDDDFGLSFDFLSSSFDANQMNHAMPLTSCFQSNQLLPVW